MLVTIFWVPVKAHLQVRFHTAFCVIYFVIKFALTYEICKKPQKHSVKSYVNMTQTNIFRQHLESGIIAFCTRVGSNLVRGRSHKTFQS